MRKFKIKNRQKRKYVKKQDLSASFAHVPELTLGVVPMLLMGIAFFATFLIGNPQMIANAVPEVHFSVPEISLPTIPEMPELTFPTLSLPEVTLPQLSVPNITFPQVTIPQLSLPEINLTVDLPQLRFPELSLPELPQLRMPEMSIPDIALPNLMPMITDSIAAASAFMNYTIQTGIESLNSTGKWLEQILEQVGATVVFVAQAAGQFITTAAVLLWNALSLAVVTATNILVQGYYRIGITFILSIQFLVSITVQAVQLLNVWIQTILTACINGISAFFWFLGSPFRALGHYSDEASVALSPLFNYLGDTFNRSINDLNAGVSSLEQSTEYVGNSVAAQQ